MNEAQGSRDDSSPSFGGVDSAFEDLATAESFTILVHGVGDEESEDLLKRASDGYSDSGIKKTIARRPLPECPSLDKKKVADALFIHGEHGGHFVIAFPWNQRYRLAWYTKACLLSFLLLTFITIGAFLVDKTGSFHSFILGSLVRMISHPHNVGSELGGSLLLIILMVLEWTITWWAPWSWVLGGILIALLLMQSWRIIIRCIPIAQQTNWRLILTMLGFALTILSAASVHTLWYVSKQMPTTNFDRPDLYDLQSKLLPEWIYGPYNQWRYDKVESKAVSMNTNLLPEAPPDKPQIIESASKHAAYKQTEPTSVSPPSDINKQSPLRSNEALELSAKQSNRTNQILHSDFAICLLLLLICVLGVSLIWKFDCYLDLALDVLDYAGKEKNNTMMFGRLQSVIRDLQSQAPNAHFIVVGHSLGSVIASHAVSSISDSDAPLGKLTLITLGSPLNYLCRVFPNVVKTPHQLSVAICSKARWINLWLSSDIVGKELDTKRGELLQYCVGKGSHTDYWKDGSVWKAVVYESLKAGDYPPKEPTKSILEAHLSLITLSSMVVLLVCGFVLWYSPDLMHWLRK
jgi:Lipase (class 3)